MKICDGSTSNALTNLVRGDAIPMQDVKGLLPHFIQSLEAVIFDCDGVLWLGMEPITGAQKLVIKLRSMGKKVFFLTNNSTKTREEYLEKFTKLGFQATIDEIIGTAYLTASYLKGRCPKNGKVYVIGTSGITGELDKVGIESLPIGPDPVPADLLSWTTTSLKPPTLDPDVSAVVVGFDHHLSFLKMIKAASYLKDPNCLFVATNTDETFPSPDIVLPGTGAMVNAVKTATGREPEVLGKPSPYAFHFLKRSHDLDPDRVLMIGDRANTDILFGKNCSLWTLLVLTGVTTLAEVDKWKSSKSASDKKLIPDFTLDGIENLLTLIDKMDEIVLPKISSPKIEKIPPKKKRACVERNLAKKLTKKGKAAQQLKEEAENVKEFYGEEPIQTLSQPEPMEDDEISGSELEFDDDEEEYILGDDNVCPSCDTLFPTRPKLEAHIKKLHPDLAEELSTPFSKRVGRKKKSNRDGSRKQEVLKCSVCDRIFNHRNSMVYHMRSHTGERPHLCQECGKSFFATSALKVHMRLHSGEKPYKCENCDRRFRQWGDLKYHVISIHSDVRQYQCEFCGKDFARKYSLVVHRRIHTGERNYQCDFCDKSFRAASYLQNHRRIHTGEKPHSCPVCEKPFRVRSDMKRHMSSHTRDNSVFPETIPLPTTSNTYSVPPVNTPASSSSSELPIIATSAKIPPGATIVSVGGQSSSNQINVRGVNINSRVAQRIIQYEVPRVVVDETNGELISGEISDSTPLKITLSPATDNINVTGVPTLQDIQENVIYQNRDGQMEVTLRDSSTGTLFVWPVFMN